MDTGPSLCLAWFCPGKANPLERACPCKAKVSRMDLGVPHSKGRSVSSPPSPQPHAGLSLRPLPLCWARSTPPHHRAHRSAAPGPRHSHLRKALGLFGCPCTPPVHTLSLQPSLPRLPSSAGPWGAASKFLKVIRLTAVCSHPQS